MAKEKDDQYEDAYLDWLPYAIGFWLLLVVWVSSLGMNFYAIFTQTFYSQWDHPNGAQVTFLIVGVLLFILSSVTWFFWLPEFFDGYKKWRRARRPYVD